MIWQISDIIELQWHVPNKHEGVMWDLVISVKPNHYDNMPNRENFEMKHFHIFIFMLKI